MAIASGAKRARRVRGPVPYEVAQVGITGMRDSYDPPTGDPKKAAIIQNAYPFMAGQLGGVIGRPGFRLFGTQLGTPGFRRGQLIFQFTRQGGTEYTIAFVGGLMYQMNWAARTITPIALGGGVVVSQTAKMYAVTFQDKMVVSDGVNLMWTWDGTTFANLVNAPVAFGKPVVYYAKLFVINAANKLQIQWSEENDPTIGWAMAIYDNTWVLGQADQQPLTALFASNEALYTFRLRSIGMIQGAVTRQFRTEGTRAGVSSTVGTASPDSITFHNDEIWFLDADSQSQVIRPGAPPLPVWADFRETTRSIPRLYLDAAVGLNYTAAGLMLMCVAQVGSTIPNLILVFNGDTYEALGVWRGFTFLTIGMVKDESLRPVVVHLSDDGYIFDHGRPEDTLWDDFLGTGTVVPIEHKVVGTPQGWDFDREVDWTELTVIARADSIMDLSVRYETPRGYGTYQNVAASGGFALYGIGVYGVATYAASTPEIRKKLGIKRLGRWIKPEVQHQALGQRFGFLGWRALGYAMPPEINVP